MQFFLRNKQTFPDACVLVRNVCMLYQMDLPRFPGFKIFFQIMRVHSGTNPDPAVQLKNHFPDQSGAFYRHRLQQLKRCKQRFQVQIIR
ncbi:hypothetical protein D3C81_1960920 [compost metagenome]